MPDGTEPASRAENSTTLVEYSCVGPTEITTPTLGSVSNDDAVSQRLAGTDAGRALDAAYAAAWACADTALLTICRDRVGMLLRHPPTIESMTPADRERLQAWPRSDHFGEAERAALEFTEQYIVDVSSITDDQATRLREELGDGGFATFVNALLVIEQRMTLDLVLGAVA